MVELVNPVQCGMVQCGMVELVNPVQCGRHVPSDAGGATAGVVQRAGTRGRRLRARAHCPELRRLVFQPFLVPLACRIAVLGALSALSALAAALAALAAAAAALAVLALHAGRRAEPFA